MLWKNFFFYLCHSLNLYTLFTSDRKELKIASYHDGFWELNEWKKWKNLYRCWISPLHREIEVQSISRGAIAISLNVHALMLTHVRQIWNIIVMLLFSSIFTDTENWKRPLLIRSLSHFHCRVFSVKMDEKNHFMNPIMDFLTLVSFYCISLFMIPHSELIPNAMTITAGLYCRRQGEGVESSIKTFFAMKRNVLWLDDGFGIIKFSIYTVQ